MVKPVFFADLCKAAVDLNNDDYTSKMILKAKTGKVPVPQVGPVKFTLEHEVKPSSDVKGSIAAKFACMGISFDKVKLKGSSYAVEASKKVNGVDFKGKGNPEDFSSLSLAAESKTAAYAITASADKKKIAGSAVAPLGTLGLFGGDITYTNSSGAIAYNVGVSAMIDTITATLLLSSKSVASFALHYVVSPKLTVAATCTSEMTDATVGCKIADVSPGLSVGLKTTKDAPSAVAVYKLSDSASFIFSASSKYDSMDKPAFGWQLNIE